MKRSILAVALAAIVSAGVGPALACEGSTVLFEDDFSFRDPAWGNYDGTIIADGALTIEVNQGGGYTLLNQASLYEDFDVCVDLVQHNDDPTNAWASIAFWGLDYENYYTFDVATNGYIKVSRLQNNRWLSPVDWTLTEGVVGQGEQVNHLRVVGQGNVATVFVNGQQVAKFRGQPPQGGSLLGIYGAASTTAGATYDFTNFKVTTADGPMGGGAMTGNGASTDETAPSPGSKQNQL